jgi:hypothetical protein
MTDLIDTTHDAAELAADAMHEHATVALTADDAVDLLAALKRIVAINGSTRGAKVLVAEFKEIARAAIAKAES